MKHNVTFSMGGIHPPQSKHTAHCGIAKADLPKTAVVMLSQGREDQVRRLSPGEAFAQLYSQITVNTWNRDFAAKNMALIEGLIARVPVFHLRCTISENAVRCLEQALSGN